MAKLAGKAGVFSLLILLLLAGSFFFLRKKIIEREIYKAVGQFDSRYRTHTFISGVFISGLATIHLSGISMVPENGDTLVRVSEIFLTPDLWNLLAGKKIIKEFQISDVTVTPVRKTASDNYTFLWKRTSAEKKTTAPSSSGYSESLHNLSERFTEMFPQRIEIRNLNFELSAPGRNLKCNLPDLSVENGRFSMKMIVNSAGKNREFFVDGIVDAKNKYLNARLYAGKNQKVVIPYVDMKWNAAAAFDSLHMELDFKDFSGGKMHINGKAGVDNLVLNHPKVAGNDVVIRKTGADFRLSVAENFFEIDSTSLFSMNSIKFHPYIFYKLSQEKIFALKISMEKMNARDFFISLPMGLFKNIEGVDADGRLDYRLDFYLNLEMPDSLRFESALNGENFKLKNTGRGNFGKLNQAFEYTAYEHGAPVQVFMVGQPNPSFYPLNEISEFLKNSVLTSEDGDFYFHHGFNQEMFGKSIAANIKAGRFARGGSTISMQLVKNIFLSRNKTIGRKLEEALIVWLIENNRLVSKERMFEVYLNIIEWGPGVYGIGQASRFYFRKKPSELNLAESIFLASIIPSPKLFRYSFDEKGNLQGYLEGYYKLLSGILLRKMIITDMEYEQLRPNVEIRGKAKQYILPADSIPADSLMMDDIYFTN